MAKATSYKTLTWIALVISIISLVIGWLAFNRSGIDLTDEIALEVQEQSYELKWELAKAEARLNLMALRIDEAAVENYRELSADVQEIRKDLNAQYIEERQEIKQEWNEIDRDLEVLENDLRTESAETVNDLQTALESLERDLKTDER